MAVTVQLSEWNAEPLPALVSMQSLPTYDRVCRAVKNKFRHGGGHKITFFKKKKKKKLVTLSP